MNIITNIANINTKNIKNAKLQMFQQIDKKEKVKVKSQKKSCPKFRFHKKDTLELDSATVCAYILIVLHII